MSEPRFLRFFISESNDSLGWDGRPLDPCWLDFYCDSGAEIPLWGEGTGMIYAESVPVSIGLRDDLMSYQWRFEELDDGPYPEEFLAAGRDLLARVRAELPSSWRVTSSWLGEPGEARQ